jgi:hypothetical protein
MTTRAEREFHREMHVGAETLKREIGYNPTRFNQMVAELGGPEAARHLLRMPDASDGFTTLWLNHRLEMSVEAFALLPWYAPLFTPAELATARQRLASREFDVEAFLERRAARPPAWTRGEAADG